MRIYIFIKPVEDLKQMYENDLASVKNIGNIQVYMEGIEDRFRFQSVLEEKTVFVFAKDMRSLTKNPVADNMIRLVALKHYLQALEGKDIETSTAD